MFKELMEKRRSIRKYTDEKLTKEEIDKIASCVFYAPTAMNFDDIELVMVTEPEKLEALSKLKTAGSDQIKGAACAAVVLSNKEDFHNTYHQDACIAATYILLQVAELGLGGCWVNILNGKTKDGETSEVYVRKLLGIPDKYNVETVISIGHPQEEIRKKVPRDPKDHVHYEKF